jgi:hypothetical protein
MKPNLTADHSIIFLLPGTNRPAVATDSPAKPHLGRAGRGFFPEIPLERAHAIC